MAFAYTLTVPPYNEFVVHLTYCWTLWEFTNELIQELFCCNLQVEGVSAILDAVIQ